MDLISGFVYKYSNQGRGGGVRFYAEYDYRGVHYKNDFGLGCIKRHPQGFVGKWFPIAIDSLNPKNVELLICPVGFEDYGLKFPDSLNWVRSYVY